MLKRAAARPTPKLTRRQLLKGGAALAGAGLTYDGYMRFFAEVNAQAPEFGRLSDIEHVVFIIQENRSFDHYFGAYKGVRGFSDPAAMRPDNSSIFAQPDPTQTTLMPVGTRYPFRLNETSPTMGAACLNDPDHSWITNHTNYNSGRMDGFMQSQVDAINGTNPDGSKGFVAMGYYTQDDLPYYYALADSYTICDRYHASLIGQSDPNRIYSLAGSIDPEGKYGGPIVNTAGTNRADLYGRLTYPTIAEQLQNAGVTWKVYQAADATPTVNLFTAFKNFGYPGPTRVQGVVQPVVPTTPAQAANPLFVNAFTPTTANYYADCLAGTLPQVSWVLASTVTSEHPPAPPALGEQDVAGFLNAILSNQTLFAKTAIFLTWDDPGGFFDHVIPPVAPFGTAGEYITPDAAPKAFPGVADITDKNNNLVLGPIGLGFRVPMIVISPFTRGGYVSSDVFDHTSMLRFLETRFAVSAPNLTVWRRGAVGDITSAFNFGAQPMPSVPDALTAAYMGVPQEAANATAECLASGLGTTVMAPMTQSPPTGVQQAGTRAMPSGPVVPTIMQLSREGSPPAGGDDIVIIGLTFKPETTVSIGGVNAVVKSISADGTHLTATIPAHPNGVVEVTVTNPGYPGTVKANAFTYGPIAPQPRMEPTVVSNPTTPAPQPPAPRLTAPTVGPTPLPQPPRR